MDEARKKLDGKERAEFINGKSDIWKDLKPELEKLSNNKCWYCESKEKRSDRAVDHYRPKNNVHDSDPPHSGYWWLAFKQENYRLSCTYCNSRRCDRESGEVGGKGDYFPLEQESKRVAAEGTIFRHEGALLLDPCNRADVSLLWYAEDGRVVPRYDEKDIPLAYKRADKSIELYNLNEVEIKEARRAIYKKIKELVNDGDLYFDSFCSGNVDADHAIGKIIANLDALITEKAEFSAYAKAIVEGFSQTGRLWMQGL